MRRTTGMLLLPTLVLLACSDTPTTANPMDELALSSAIDNPCPTCAYGPRKFPPRPRDPFHDTFIPRLPQTRNCTLQVQDDGDGRTSVQVWLNGPTLLPHSALLGPTRRLLVPVTLISGRNTIEVLVHGPQLHGVWVRIDCGDRVDIAPERVQRLTGETQQFSVWGSPGPHTWSVNGTDGGNSTFGTINAAGLYTAPVTVPTPASFPVCARVTATPTISKCATVTIVQGPTSSMRIWSGDGQAAQPGSPVLIPPAVLVTRADGSPWPGVVITFAVATGGGSVTGATAPTGADGIATVGSWTLGETPGLNTLTATAAESGIAGNPVTFAALGGESAQGNLTMGLVHTCGIAANGRAYCWGSNFVGALGDGTTINRLEPTAVAGGYTFSKLSAGTSHTCGLTPAGLTYCWGFDLLFRTTPTLVEGGLVFKALAAGGKYTCGLVDDGAAYCWGENTFGQLGDGSTTLRSLPTAVLGGLTFVTIVASKSPAGLPGGPSFDHTCGLTSTGTAYCWGRNANGQLGDGTRNDRLVPTPVASSHVFTTITVGEGHTCGLSSGGVAYCWGNNYNGQLGNGTRFTEEVLPVQVHGGLIFNSLEAGWRHTCGLAAGGEAWCWGNTGYEPFNGDYVVPTAVPGAMTFSQITAGQGATCGVASGGAAFCLGYNGYGELGDGTTVAREVPTAVIGGLTFGSPGP